MGGYTGSIISENVKLKGTMVVSCRDIVGGKAYGTLGLEGLRVGDMVCLEFDGFGVEGCEEGLCEGQFGHFVRSSFYSLIEQ